MRDKNEIMLVIAAPRHRSIVNDRAFFEIKRKRERRTGRTNDTLSGRKANQNGERFDVSIKLELFD